MNRDDNPPIAVITGGTTGIGFAITQRLLRANYRAAIFSHRTESVIAAHQALEAEFGPERIFSDAVDLSMPSEIADFFKKLEEAWGSPAVLVCNAGISPKGSEGANPFDAITLAEWNAVLSVNLTGAMLCCQAVIPPMVKHGFGRIVLIGSVAARKMPKVAGASYVASKAALSGLTKSLVGTYARHGITTNLVAPGRILTSMTGSADTPTNISVLTSIPAGRLGHPDDVAAAVEFLVSSDAGFVNGATLDVNGGEFVPT